MYRWDRFFIFISVFGTFFFIYFLYLFFIESWVSFNEVSPKLDEQIQNILTQYEMCEPQRAIFYQYKTGVATFPILARTLN